MIIAVDFDDTLFQYVPPPPGTEDYSGRPGSIGRPNHNLIKFLRLRRADGDKLVLWTCREGIALEEAVAVCRKFDLHFDAVNANLPGTCPKGQWPDSRKIKADLYLDDKAVRVQHFPAQAPGCYFMSTLRDAEFPGHMA